MQLLQPQPLKKSGETSPLEDKLKRTLNYDELVNCMRCGFCLPACPTYRETGLEAASPRGRIALLKASVDGLIEPDQSVVDQLNLCLGCRACEPACPSGVKYGHLLEEARDAIADHAGHSRWVKFLRKLAFKHFFPKQKNIYRVGKLLAFYQRSGLQSLVRKLGLLSLLPRHLREMERVLPRANGNGLIKELGTSKVSPLQTSLGSGTAAPEKGGKTAAATAELAASRTVRVGMFRGCIMDILFLETNKNTVKLLAAAGCEVVIPETQNCCGALHAHSGERKTARELAQRNIRAFREAGVDYIVSNAGGCGAMLKEYDHLLHADPEWRDDAKWFAERVRDVSEILVQAGKPLRFHPLPKRVTYQDSCHLRNVMRVFREPRQLLSRIPGVEYVELFEADRCCGSAGIYNIVQPEMSASLLEEKMEHVQETKADLLVTANPGCLLQMRLCIHRAGLGGRMAAVHLVDALAVALDGKETD
ncbi:(Fe-S)-binding protein [Bacillaceae bacterium]